jgi:hypothetical protein
LLRLKLNLKLEKTLTIRFLSSPSYWFWRLVVLKVSSVWKREIRIKLKIMACYPRKWVVTQGGGACSEQVEMPAQI